MGLAMNEFERARQDCQLGAKAFQNLHASFVAFERLYQLVRNPDPDDLVASSVFQMGVIRYAKPFTSVKTAMGTVQYPIHHLTRSGFSRELHDHLLALRDTLIAHDDIREIQPRLLSFVVGSGAVHTPALEVTISNKCLERPAGTENIERLITHVRAAMDGALEKLTSDLGRFRQATIEYPEQAAAAKRFSKHLGQIHIPVEGAHFEIPDLSNEAYLDIPEPTFATGDQYVYSRLNMRVRFENQLTVRISEDRILQIVPRGDDTGAV
jgi:hypothetical protein